VKHDHYQTANNDHQSFSLIPRAAKKLLLTPNPDHGNGMFDSTQSTSAPSDRYERFENPVTPKSVGKKILGKLVPSMKTTPDRPETPEMDPKAEQFFGKGSHERKKSHLFDKFKNKGKDMFSRSMIDLVDKSEGSFPYSQFEDGSPPLRHKYSRMPADARDTPFWDVKQAQKERIHAIRDARIAENQEVGELLFSGQPSCGTSSIARSTSLRYLNDEMPPTPPSKDRHNPPSALESENSSLSTQRLQSNIARSNCSRLADQDANTEPDTVNLSHVKQESVRIYQGSPTRKGGCVVKDTVKLIERQISYNSLCAETSSSSPPPQVPFNGDTLVMTAITNINHQQAQVQPSAFPGVHRNLAGTQNAGDLDVAAISAQSTAHLVRNTNVAETVNQFRHAQRNSAVFSIPEEEVDNTPGGGSGVVDLSNIHPAFRQEILATRSVSPSNYSTYATDMQIPFPDVKDMVNDNLRQGCPTGFDNRSSLAPRPLRITSRGIDPVPEQPAAAASQRQSSVSWQSATSWNNEVNDRILKLESRVDLMLSSVVMLIHDFRRLRDIEEDLRRRIVQLEQLVNQMDAVLEEEPDAEYPAPAAPTPTPVPTPIPSPAPPIVPAPTSTPVDASLGRRNSVVQRLANMYVAEL